MSERRRVVVIGGGFGGLWAVQALAREPVDITLIDRCNHHLFQPLLYQVATAGLAAPSIAAPLRHILRRQKNVTVLLGEIDAIDLESRTVRIAPEVGCEPHHLPYDYLIVASGATHAYFGRDDWATHAPGLKSLDDALGIRGRILTAFERAESEADTLARDAWLTFAVIGAGPTGAELAGTLAEIAHHTLADEFRHADPRRARVLLIEAGPRVLGAFDADLSEKARLQLERLGVEVLTGKPVTDLGEGYVALGDQRISARTVLWAAGVAASPLGRLLGTELDRAGRVRVAQDLSLPARNNVFVVGDLASISVGGKPVPGVAPAAKQMGAHAAKCIAASLKGRPREAFRYRDYGSLATLGRRAAIVQLSRLKLSGVLAWTFWLSAHIVFLIGFRNRLVVLLDWAWAYFTYKRSARIIVKG